MATRIFLRPSSEALVVNGTYPNDFVARLMTRVSASSTAFETVTTEAGASELRLLQTGSTIGHYSERVADQQTISSTVTVNLQAKATAGANASIRVKLFKKTRAGAGDIESFIGSGDMAVALTTTATVYSVTITPTTTIVAPMERFIVRFYAIPAPSQTMGAGQTVTLDYGIAASWIEFTETVVFADNKTTLRLQRTAVNAIGNFFDLMPTQGASAFTTGVVNTVAGGTEIQWTRTAGGTVLEWITPRLKYGFRFEDPGLGGSNWAADLILYAFESNSTANCAMGIRLLRWRSAVETLLTNMTRIAELGTSVASQSLDTDAPSGLFPNDIHADDRLVLRVYIVPASGQTMGGGRTCTLNYDHNVAGASGDSRLRLFEGTVFKDEADPAETGIIPSGTSLMGMGNGM